MGKKIIIIINEYNKKAKFIYFIYNKFTSYSFFSEVYLHCIIIFKIKFMEQPL